MDLFEEDTAHGFIHIDANNAFNSINRTLLLHNVRILSPEIAANINNCYMKPPDCSLQLGKRSRQTKEPPKVAQ